LIGSHRLTASEFVSALLILVLADDQSGCTADDRGGANADGLHLVGSDDLGIEHLLALDHDLSAGQTVVVAIQTADGSAVAVAVVEHHGRGERVRLLEGSGGKDLDLIVGADVRGVIGGEVDGDIEGGGGITSGHLEVGSGETALRRAGRGGGRDLRSGRGISSGGSDGRGTNLTARSADDIANGTEVGGAEGLILRGLTEPHLFGLASQPQSLRALQTALVLSTLTARAGTCLCLRFSGGACLCLRLCAGLGFGLCEGAGADTGLVLGGDLGGGLGLDLGNSLGFRLSRSSAGDLRCASEARLGGDRGLGGLLLQLVLVRLLLDGEGEIVHSLRVSVVDWIRIDL